MLKQIKCQNCGGVLKYDEDDVQVFEGNVIMWRPRGRALTCKSCGSKFERGDDLAHDKGTVTVLGGGVIIKGRATVYGDIVGRDLRVIRKG